MAVAALTHIDQLGTGGEPDLAGKFAADRGEAVVAEQWIADGAAEISGGFRMLTIAAYLGCRPESTVITTQVVIVVREAEGLDGIKVRQALGCPLGYADATGDAVGGPRCSGAEGDDLFKRNALDTGGNINEPPTEVGGGARRDRAGPGWIFGAHPVGSCDLPAVLHHLHVGAYCALADRVDGLTGYRAEPVTVGECLVYLPGASLDYRVTGAMGAVTDRRARIDDRCCAGRA